MIRKLTAFALLTVSIGACSAGQVGGEEESVTSTTDALTTTCSATGLEWKPFLARMAHDAAVEFGRWEFTTDLVNVNGRLYISDAGFAQCAAHGKSGCPLMTAALTAQDGSAEIQNEKGQVIMNPMTIRSQLVNGFQAQQINEANQQSLTDLSAPSAYQTFRSPSQTGLPHTITMANCAVTLYSDYYYGGTSQCLGTGNFRMADLQAGVGNDAVSSIKVRSDIKVSLYQNDSYGGSSLVLNGTSSYALSNFNDQTSSLVVQQNDASCSTVDTYQINGAGSNWNLVRAKLVTLGYLRGNDLLNVRLDLANNTIDVDPFNVDFVPPAQVGAAQYGVAVTSPTAETWRSTEDPAPSVFPVGAACAKRAYGASNWLLNGIVKSSGSYRYCYASF